MLYFYWAVLVWMTSRSTLFVRYPMGYSVLPCAEPWTGCVLYTHSSSLHWQAMVHSHDTHTWPVATILVTTA